MSRPGWLVSVVAGALLLAGCSGAEPSASPPSEPPSTTPATSAPTPTPTPPPLPADAKGLSRESAQSFVYHYIDLINLAVTTGETDSLRAVSLHGCRGCSRLMRGVEDVYRDGGWIRSEGWTAKTWSSPGRRPMRERVVSVVVRMPDETRKSSRTSAVETSRPSEGAITFRVRHRAHAWSVAEMGLM